MAAFFLLSLFALTVGSPVGLCTAQDDCIRIVGATGDNTKCSEGKRLVCISWNNLSGTCAKSTTDTISHVCIPGKKVDSWMSGVDICETVNAGETAKFVVKDGDGCGTSNSTISSPSATCTVGPQGFCGDSGSSVECLWSVKTDGCAVDCQMSAWSEWGFCDKTCGKGNMIRTRTITVQPAFGGSECGPTVDSAPCNITPCPVDCVLSEWQPWGNCDKSCGGGSITRTRIVVVESAHGGCACGALFETAPCNVNPCPVDCVLSDWTKWSSCDKSCGEGTMTRSRTVQVSPLNGGCACGPLDETAPCNVDPCPINCVVSEWQEWKSCDKSCGSGIMNRERIIEVEASNGGSSCGPLSETAPCNVFECPVNCVMTSWTPWGSCDKTCGGGQMSRERSIQTTPQNGGCECGETQEFAPCNVFSCESGSTGSDSGSGSGSGNGEGSSGTGTGTSTGTSTGSSSNGPASLCSYQHECLHIVGQFGDESCSNGHRNVCIYWDNSSGNCRKSTADTISHVCSPGIKTEKWVAGESYKVCVDVAGGGAASFVVKDGSGCSSSTFPASLPDQGTCAATTTNGFCGDNGQSDECLWTFPTGECPITPVH